jgi:hypothetical protein
MSLAQTLWPNADPDADGKAPLGQVIMSRGLPGISMFLICSF